MTRRSLGAHGMEKERRARRAVRCGIAVASGLVAIALIPAGPAAAEPPEYPHGVGVCLSQLATDPSIGGLDHLGQLVVGGARPGSPGSDIPAALDDVRGDGPGGCGAPPGPRHLD